MTRGLPFSSPFYWSCRCLEEYIVQGWKYILPWWRWLHQSQPIKDPSVGLRFPQRVGRYRTEDHGFHPRVVGVVDVCKEFDPGMRSYHPRVALVPRTPAPQPISDPPVVLGFPHRAGCYRPEDHRFRPRFVGFLIRGWNLILPGWGGTSAFPRRALGADLCACHILII